MIILNNMYTGRYITESGKLGHEIINFFKADNGKFYIWLNSMGICTRTGVDNSTVIMVRSINSKLYKVLAKAENCSLCDGAGISRRKGSNDDTGLQRYEEQRKLNVTYNGKSPEEIFDEKDMFATFVTEKVYEANGDVYITNDQSLENCGANIFYVNFKISEAMRAYCAENDLLGKLISNTALWKNDVSPKVSEIVKDKYLRERKPEFNIFKLIRKNKDELSFSNALAYFVGEGKDSYFEFLQHIGVAESFLKDKYEILREKNDIDISFFGEKHVVIIENKIDAAITANKKMTIDNQINKAIKGYIEGENEGLKAKNIIEKFIENNPDKIISQLSKYYIFALAYLISKGVAEKDLKNSIKCFLLVPKYSKNQFSNKYLSGFICGEEYELITYEKISEYFWALHSCDHYLAEFLSAMKPLTREFDNEIEEDLKYRFFEKICIM